MNSTLLASQRCATKNQNYCFFLRLFKTRKNALILFIDVKQGLTCHRGREKLKGRSLNGWDSSWTHSLRSKAMEYKIWTMHWNDKISIQKASHFCVIFGFNTPEYMSGKESIIRWSKKGPFTCNQNLSIKFGT